MKKISILGLHLGYGGVEQAIVNLANILCEDYQVKLVVTYKVLEKSPYDINPKVEVYYLSNQKPNREEFMKSVKSKKIMQTLKEGMKSISILKMRKKTMIDYIKNSDDDIIISSRILYTKLLSQYAKKGVITIAQEHCHHNNNQKYIQKLKKACKNIDYLIPVSKELTDFYQKNIQNGKTKMYFIPNSLDVWTEKTSSLEEKNIISVGRISPEKGYLDLIDVFERVHQEIPDWKLHIIGDGKEKDLLCKKIQEKNLEQSVFIHGFQKKEYIYEQLSHCSIYVMCSYEESFGLVLIEAALLGLPMIAYSSARGAHEIIEHEKNGYLIENRDCKEMAHCIKNLALSYQLRKQLGEEAKKSVKKYSFPVVKEQWLQFLSTLEEPK